MKYNKTRPCKDCPFRISTKFEFTYDRALQIATQDAGFICHKTGKHTEDSGIVDTGKSEACAGRMIMLERDETPDQMMRIAERLGMYDRSKLKMDDPDVFDSLDDFLDERGNL